MELSYSCCKRRMMASNCSSWGLSRSNSWRLAAAALSASLSALHAVPVLHPACVCACCRLLVDSARPQIMQLHDPLQLKRMV